MAAYSIVLLSAIAIPTIFNISEPDVFAFPKTVLTVAMAAVLVVVMVIRWLASPTPFQVPRSGLVAALGVFLAWSVLAWWFATDRLHALVGERLQFQGLAVTGAYAVFMVTAWVTVRTPQRRMLFILAVAAGGTLVALYAVAQRAGLDPIWPSLPDDRVFSIDRAGERARRVPGAGDPHGRCPGGVAGPWPHCRGWSRHAHARCPGVHPQSRCGISAWSRQPSP